MAFVCGRYNARSDWLSARSEQSLRSRNAYGPITDYANYEEPGLKIQAQEKEKSNLIPSS